MIKLLGIDPGPTQSAWLVYDVGGERPTKFGIAANGDLLDLLMSDCAEIEGVTDAAIEMVQHYGPDMHAGKEIFETCVWIGRFIHACAEAGIDHKLLYRPKIKAHLCGMTNAKDKNVRQALIDRWGGEVIAIGNKKSPGPLHGISKDVWSALAIAVVYADSLSEATP